MTSLLLLFAISFLILAIIVFLAYHKRMSSQTAPLRSEASQKAITEQVADVSGQDAEVQKTEAPSKPSAETPDTGEQAIHEEELPIAEPSSRARRPAPEQRGGRPRGPANPQEESKRGGETRCPKPEIICWKRERQWRAAVEIPEELFESPTLVVLQNGLSLTQDESKEGCWHLKEAYGQVVVQWEEDEFAREIKIALGEEGYLLFKLSGQDQNQGRRVKSPSSGSYLVMVPDNWERDDTLSGPPPATPESVALTRYQAHFFELEKEGDRKIAFRTPMGKPFVIEPKAPQFELVGNRLNDASADKSPLFGEAPPRIRALNEQGWKNVRTIVVGEEGSGKGRWRTAFSPVPGRVEQELPPELAARKGGWYFLRFYDTNDDLIESLDFRFLCALKDIRVLQPPPLPCKGEHKPVYVEFLHKPGCSVQLEDSPADIHIERHDDKTTVTIPPDPTYDETRWIIAAKGGPQVKVSILVERVWWSVGGEKEAPSEWKDQPLILPRDDFAATSTRALWLRVPRRGWVDKVLVGFEQPRARSYDVKVTEKTIAVPLREFVDCKEMNDRAQEHLLKVWIKRDNNRHEGLVGIIRAEKPAGADKEHLKKRDRLNLDKIPAPRLATALTCLRRQTRGPLRVLVKEIHRGYFRERSLQETEAVEFKKWALCMIALVMEETREVPRLNKRYVVKAQLARDKFPEIMKHLRDRYKEISINPGQQASSKQKRRKTA